VHEITELGLFKWMVENIAVPLLGGMWTALAWWVKLISDKFGKVEAAQKSDTADIHDRISAMERNHAETYARRDDVREGFARIDGKLDVLLKHALKDSQG
jgi:hypothetical protein